MRSRGYTAWVATVLVVACIATYWNSLQSPFVYDDELTIGENRSIRAWRLPDVFIAEQDSPTAGRPLVNVSFALNYAIGALDVRHYHATNLAIHILCALVLFGLLRRTLELPSVQRAPILFQASSKNVAFAIALVWALHPLNSEVVNYVTQRTESLMALLYLCTLYAAVRAAASGGSARWQSLAVAACALGMACKESMVTAPVAVVLYDRAYLFDSLKTAVRRRWPVYLALASTWLVLAALLGSAPRGESAGFVSGVSPWTYLLNQTVIVSEYLRHAIWPRDLVAGYGWVMPYTLSDVLPFAILMMSLLAIAVAAWIFEPRIGFLGVWFFLTLAPTSSIVPIPIEVGAERRMYLPLIALVLLACVAVLGIWQAVNPKWLAPPGGHARSAGAVALVAVSIALAMATVVRNHEYSLPLVLYRTAVERWPSALGYHIMGSALVASGLDADAEKYLRAALDGAPRAHYDLGVSLFNRGKLDEAIGHLQELVGFWESPPPTHPYWQPPVRGDVIAARLLMGRAFARREDWSRASVEFERVVDMRPNDIEARYLLASALFSARNFDQSIRHYRVYLESRPDDVTALTNLGIALISGGHEEEAIAVFRRAVDVDPANGSSQRNLANALFDHGDMAGAAKHAAAAVKLRTDDQEARDLLARATRQSLDATRQRH